MNEEIDYCNDCHSVRRNGICVCDVNGCPTNMED